MCRGRLARGMGERSPVAEVRSPLMVVALLASASPPFAPSFFGMELVDLGLTLACGAAAVWPPAMWAMALYRLLEPGLAGSQSSSAE